MEGEIPWVGWREEASGWDRERKPLDGMEGEEAPGWNGRDMIHCPETFPKELKLLLSFLLCDLETMFALRILGNAEPFLFILCRGTFGDLQTPTLSLNTPCLTLTIQQNPGSLKCAVSEACLLASLAAFRLWPLLCLIKP